MPGDSQVNKYANDAKYQNDANDAKGNKYANDTNDGKRRLGRERRRR